MGTICCSNCKHSIPRDAKICICRRYPPKVVDAKPTGEVLASFPVVRVDSVCGEWEAE